MSRPACRFAVFPALLLVACGPSAEGLPGLGSFEHDASSVSVEAMATVDDGLATPRDLAFDPEDPEELWVVNLDTNSATILVDVGTGEHTARNPVSFGNRHFMARPSALAFGEHGTFATAQEEDERTQGPNGTPADFMGPTLWTSDLADFTSGHAGHLDMLHNSPNGAGIAWEAENTYWVFDGYHASLTRYAFHGDHGLGGADHSDGVVYRYAEGEVAYVGDVPSHLEYDPETGWLYVADTGNGRIAVLDTTTGETGGAIRPNYDGTVQSHVDGAEIWTLVDDPAAQFPDAPAFVHPSGLERDGDVLYVSDNATGVIYAFDLDGALLDWLDTGLPEGALMGLATGPDGHLWAVDALGQEVLRIKGR